MSMNTGPRQGRKASAKNAKVFILVRPWRNFASLAWTQAKALRTAKAFCLNPQRRIHQLCLFRRVAFGQPRGGGGGFGAAGILGATGLVLDGG